MVFLSLLGSVAVAYALGFGFMCVFASKLVD